jgi:uncharacterized membrane protein
MRLALIYWLAAALLATAGWVDLRARRWAHAAFWLILALLFASGDEILALARSGQRLPQQLCGAAVVALALLAAFGLRAPAPAQEDSAAPRRAQAARLGHRLFLPALAIPLLTAALVLAAPQLRVGGMPLLPEQPTLAALTLACLVAVLMALRVTGATPGAAVSETSRLLDTLGWAAVLPMLLAALGNVFAVTGVGAAVADLVQHFIPVDNRLACLAAYAVGMALFTAIMGNAFAAFPVLAGGIALPLLVGRHHGDPAVLGSLGMLAGYCGTLVTPMAANFNLVPVALLELRDANAVIRAQAPTAAVLFLINFLFMAWLVFR